MVAYPDVEASAPPATEETPVPYVPAPSADAADAGEQLKALEKRVNDIRWHVIGDICFGSFATLILVLSFIVFLILPGITALQKDLDAIKAHDVTDKAELDRLSDAVRLIAELDKSAWQHTREAILGNSNTTMTQKVARVEEVDAKMKQLRKRLVA
mmetsp:Transcript_7312/g.17807  ORF Transcript_7312/g.17807 Transcript_7312/m.17807 type:complete len:156 (-) Transcript_7312:74-541(-)